MSDQTEEPTGGTYPYKWETDTILSDGRTVAIRPIKPSDADRIEEFHGRLSPESIYFRFFTPMPKLSEVMLSRFVNVDYVDRMALIALLGDVIIAVARYDRLPGSGTAEVAFLVDDAHQGRGLATLMLEFLVEAAREAGIHRFIADTLPENARMLRVFRDAGFADTRAFEDGVIRVTFDIEPTVQSVKRMQARERLAVARSVRRIVAPKSIAVVGASRDVASVGNVVFRNILESCFEGPVYPVNRAASYVSSVRAYPSLSAIPDDIDLVVVAVPAAEITALVQEAAEKQIGGMVIISTGFSDTSDEGAQAERELVRLARKNGMRVVGPASMGVANTSPLVSLNATLAPYGLLPGRAALISHSGSLGLAIVEEARRRGLGLSCFVSSGNRADISSNDMLHYWELDDNTDVILLYLESFGNPRTFARVARRVARSKPIVAVKARRYTDVAASVRAALPEEVSREQTIVSPGGKTIKPIAVDDAVDALMKYTGVIRIDSIEQLFELGHGLVSQPLPRGRRVAILSNRGGPAPLAQDACEAAGLKMAKLSDETKESLRELVPQARYSNPFELPAAIEPEAYGKALAILLADPGVDAALVLYIPTVTGRVTPVRTSADSLSAEADQRSSAAVMGARGVAQQIALVAQQEGVALPKPVLANFLTLPGIPVELRRYSREVPSFEFPDMAAIVLARMADYYAWKSTDEGEPPEFDGVDMKRAAAIIAKALEGGRASDCASEPAGAHSAWITGAEAAELLGCYSIATKEHVEVAGYLSFELSVPIDLSASHDPIFGPFISMGIAGEISELLAARATATLPLFTSDIPAFIDSIPAVALINGAAGRKPHDIASLADLVGRVGAMIDDHFAIANLEANVISTPSGCYVASAEVRVVDWTPPPMTTVRSLT